jgi:hypothetical protein
VVADFGQTRCYLEEELTDPDLLHQSHDVDKNASVLVVGESVDRIGHDHSKREQDLYSLKCMSKVEEVMSTLERNQAVRHTSFLA